MNQGMEKKLPLPLLEGVGGGGCHGFPGQPPTPPPPNHLQQGEGRSLLTLRHPTSRAP